LLIYIFCRKANQRIIELESKVEELTTNGGPSSVPVSSGGGSREELEAKLAEANKKVSK